MPRRRDNNPADKPWARAKEARRILTPDEQWAEELAEAILAGCHPLQRAGVADPSRRITFLVGRGGGKTTAKRARGVIKCARIPRAKVLYFAKTRMHAKDLLWYPLKDFLDRMGVEAFFSEVELRCTFKRTGAVYQLSGADDMKQIEKWRGQSFNEVQIDEGASHPPELLSHLIHRIIGPRLGDRDGCIVMGGTPGHILRGDFYDATRPGSDKHTPHRERARLGEGDVRGWSSHTWTLKDVVELPGSRRTYPALVKLWEEALVEKREQRWSDDNPVWRREYLGQWAADDTENLFKYRPHLEDGTPWNQWDPPRVGPMQLAKLPEEFNDWAHVVAMDEGLSDPFACNLFAFSPSDPERNIYHRYGFEQPKMYAQPIARLLLGENLSHERLGGVFGAIDGWPDGLIGDFGNALIEELSNVYGIQVVQSDRSHKYKFAAIEVVNGDLVDGRLHILKGSTLETQLLELQWVTDEFGGVKENKAQANHSSDTLIIGRKLIGQLITAGAVQPLAEAPKRDPIETDRTDVPAEGDDSQIVDLLADGDYVDTWGND